MRRQSVRVIVFGAIAGCLLTAGAARAATAEVCVAIDEARDNFSPTERAAAILALGRQFELAGESVVAAPCANQYVASHVRLGDTIAITLAGPTGRRDATAIGLNDVPHVYNQLVRSLVTGRPISAVIDRDNVSEAQADKLRVYSDAVTYTRLGYGSIFADGARGVPSVGLIGYRHELDSFGIDVSFLNFQVHNSRDSSGPYSYDYDSAFSGSWVKLEGLYFLSPHAAQTAYAGGGLSYGGTSVTVANKYWSGSGLQGELTVGYELSRASTIRVFVQADAVLPFYQVAYTSYSRTGATTSSRYAPSLTVSLGLGRQRNRRS
jgi:hypothetical protein